MWQNLCYIWQNSFLLPSIVTYSLRKVRLFKNNFLCWIIEFHQWEITFIRAHPENWIFESLKFLFLYTSHYLDICFNKILLGNTTNIIYVISYKHIFPGEESISCKQYWIEWNYQDSQATNIRVSHPRQLTQELPSKYKFLIFNLKGKKISALRGSYSPAELMGLDHWDKVLVNFEKFMRGKRKVEQWTRLIY